MNFPHTALAAATGAAVTAAVVALTAVLPASAQEGHASPSPTPHGDRKCPAVAVSYVPGTAGQETQVRVSADVAPSSWRLTRLLPSPAGVVRQTPASQAASATEVVWTIRLGETTRLRAEALSDGGCINGGDGSSEAVFDAEVRPVLTIAARRNSTRDYTFTGRVLPGRGQQVVLYRTGPDGGGSRVLTARTVVRSDGTYRIDRRFSGSGRFGFYSAGEHSGTNLPGNSPVRPTLIY